LLKTGSLTTLWEGLQASGPYQPGQDWVMENPYRRPTAQT